MLGKLGASIGRLMSLNLLVRIFFIYNKALHSKLKATDQIFVFFIKLIPNSRYLTSLSARADKLRDCNETPKTGRNGIYLLLKFVDQNHPTCVFKSIVTDLNIRNKLC